MQSGNPSMLLMLKCPNHSSKITNICSVEKCPFILECLVCRSQHSKMGHATLSIKEIQNHHKSKKLVTTVAEEYEEYIINLKKAFFKLWMRFDKESLRFCRVLEGRTPGGVITEDNVRVLGVKYGLDSQYDFIFGSLSILRG